MRTLVFIAAAGLASCSQPSADDVFTLYRDSALDANMRIHIASFDTVDGKEYNQENCRIAANLFKAQPGVTVRYWCEVGRYRK